MTCPYLLDRIKKTDTHGFSLLEIMVAMLILSVGLLGTAALIVGIIRGNQVSRNITIATTLANDMSEYLAGLDYNELPSTDTTSTEDYGDLTDNPTFKRVTTTYVNDPDTNMKRVVVQVYWQSGSNPVTIQSIYTK